MLQTEFYWPSLFKYARRYVLACDHCQIIGNISRRHEIPLNYTLEVKIFNVWGIDYMGSFPSSCNNRYILVAVNYVSKLVETLPSPTNDAKTVITPTNDAKTVIILFNIFQGSEFLGLL